MCVHHTLHIYVCSSLYDFWFAANYHAMRQYVHLKLNFHFIDSVLRQMYFFVVGPLCGRLHRQKIELHDN
jgi:hypothetical protein